MSKVFAEKKNIFNPDHVSSMAQVSDVNNTCEPQVFLEFVNESGRGSDMKIRSHFTDR